MGNKSAMNAPGIPRQYKICAKMFEILGIQSIKLLTNNPLKIENISKYDINVVERVPLEVGKNSYNVDYLKTKQKRMGHMLNMFEEK